MKKLTYSEKLKDPRWQKKRLQIFERDLWICSICLDNKQTLNVHHLKYTDGNPWEIENDFLVTLCEDCHMVIEILKKFPDFKFEDIRISKIKSKNYLTGYTLVFVQFRDELEILLRKEGDKKFMVSFDPTFSEISGPQNLMGKCIRNILLKAGIDPDK